MSRASTRLDDWIVEALDATGIAYSVEVGAKHLKVRMAGYLVLVVSRGNVRDAGRERKNCLATIRRAAEAIRRGERPR